MKDLNTIGLLNAALAMNAEIATLKQQLAEAQRDAARYRWLRDGGIYMWFDSTSNVSCEELDAAIDQAMREGE